MVEKSCSPFISQISMNAYLEHIGAIRHVTTLLEATHVAVTLVMCLIQTTLHAMVIVNKTGYS